MYLSPQQQEIYGRLKEWISQGRHAPGTLFPKEVELAEQFRVARNTLRPCLERLVAEGLVVRIKRKGTFVKNPDKGRKLIFLVPCPGFLDSPSVSALRLRHMLRGVSAAAQSIGVPLETICLTPDNQPDNLDWKQLARIGQADGVFCPATWGGEKLFPYLAERGCRTAVVTGTPKDMRMLEAYRQSWRILRRRVDLGVERGIAQLHAQGCQKLALAAPFLDEPEHPALTAYEKMTASLGLAYQRWLLLPRQEAPEMVAQLHAKHPFDALVTTLVLESGQRPDNLAAYFGVPSSVRLFSFSQPPEWLQPQPNLSWLDFPFAEIGSVAAHDLTSEDFPTGVIDFEGTTRHGTDAHPGRAQAMTEEAWT